MEEPLKKSQPEQPVPTGAADKSGFRRAPVDSPAGKQGGAVSGDGAATSGESDFKLSPGQAPSQTKPSQLRGDRQPPVSAQPTPSVAQPGAAEVSARKKIGLPHVPISFNAPVILGFAALSLIALLLGLITGGAANTVLFSTYRTSALDPLAFVRMFTYVLGHADFEHWISNITLLLIVGPMIEEKYGSVRTLLLILITAVSTALVNDLLFSTGLMGASGVVFAMVLLSSFASYEKGSIPLTLILVAVILIGGQVVAALQPDNVSQFAHIFGGLIGCAAGFLMNRKPRPKKGKK